MIEFLSFHPVKKSGSLIGFVGFKYNNEFSFNEIPVHKILEPASQKRQIRLRYPDNVFPFNVETQTEIDQEVSAYITANYKECLMVKKEPNNV